MKTFSFILFFIIFVLVSLLKSEAKSLRHQLSNQNHHESIANFVYQPLEKIKNSLNEEIYEELNAKTIPIYFIVSPKTNTRTQAEKQKKDLAKHTNIFDDKGMIYITKPKAVRNGENRISILDDMEAIDRRSFSNYDLTRNNKRALKNFVNQELNKKLIAKNAMRRFIDKYDKEYNFNDLVM